MRAWAWAALLLTAGAAPVAAQGAHGTPHDASKGLHIGMYMDTAALRAALATVPAARSRKRVARVFRVTFDRAGRPLQTEPVAPRAMPEVYAAAVIPLIQAALRPIFPTKDGCEKLILVDAGNAPRIEEISLPLQRPRVLNPGRLSRAMVGTATAMARADTTLRGRTLQGVLEMSVTEDGVPGEACVRVSTGFVALDDAAMKMVYLIRLRAGRLDGEPVPLLVALPFTVIIEDDPETAYARRKR